jgi:hypothetical protein
MESGRITKQIIAYMPRRKRMLGKPLNGWHESLTGHMA